MIESTCIYCNTTNIIFEEEIPENGRCKCDYCKRYYYDRYVYNYPIEKRKNYKKFLASKKKQEELKKQLCLELCEEISKAKEKGDTESLFADVKFLRILTGCKLPMHQK